MVLNEARSPVERTGVFFLVCLPLITLATLIWVLFRCRFGYEYTEEGYYLPWLAHPSAFPGVTTLFGFVYHPLYRLFRGDIAAMRQANVLLTYSCGWVLCWSFFKSVYARRVSSPVVRAALSSAVALSSLVFLRTWLVVPSYNSLALQALMLTLTGLLLTEKRLTAASLTGWVLTGFGGWLMFMGKPTTAILTGGLAGLYLICAGKLRWLPALISLGTAVALLVASMGIIDGSPGPFIERLRLGTELAVAAGGGYTLLEMLRVDPLIDFKFSGLRLLFLASAGSCVAAICFRSQKKGLLLAGAACCLLLAAGAVATISGMTYRLITFRIVKWHLLWSIPLAAVVVRVSAGRCGGEAVKTRMERWGLCVVLLLCPYAYAFGTNTNLWQLGSAAGICWVLAGLLVAAPGAGGAATVRTLTALGLALQMVVVMIVGTGMEEPHRQTGALRTFTSRIDMGPAGATLFVSSASASYIEEARRAAAEAGFEPGTPVIDLTGYSQGLLYAIGALHSGGPLFGGYPGTEAAAMLTLNALDCEELARAWLIVEPEEPTRLSMEILSVFGADIGAGHYEEAAVFMRGDGVAGRSAAKQQLLRPVRDVALAVEQCRAARRTEP